MLSTALTCLVLIAPVFAPGTESHVDDAAPENLILSVRYYEKETEGDTQTEKVFAEGSLAVETGRRFVHISGGAPTVEGTAQHEFPFGTSFEGKVVRASENQYRLTMSTSVGQWVFEPSTPSDIVIRSNQVGLQLTMELDETKRVSCGGQEWCEVRVEAAP